MSEKFAEWIERQYLEWQIKEGGRKSITEFATWLGFGKSTVAQWMNDQRKPNQENVLALAQKLGMGVYDVLGLLRPDPLLFNLQKYWDYLTEDDRVQVGEISRKAEQKDEEQEKAKRKRIVEQPGTVSS